MNRETITIKGESYKVGFSFRAIREYEKLTKKSVTECTGTWENLQFFYCTLKALNTSFQMDIEQFTDELDARPELLAQFQTAAVENSEPQTPNSKHETNQKKNTNYSGLWTLSLLLLVSPVLVPLISMIALIWLSLKLSVRLIAKIGRKRASRS